VPIIIIIIVIIIMFSLVIFDYIPVLCGDIAGL